MTHNRIVTENHLDQWVRGNSRDAQGVIVELLWRLVSASSPNPKERRFPLGDSIGQHGPDGVLDTDFAFEPFVPEGRSFWEIGTGVNAHEKATSAYRDLVSSIPEAVRRQVAFVFVTPLSGRRDWQYTWKEDEQAKWVEHRRERNEWRSVRVIDGSNLIDWFQHFPSVEHWLAGKMGLPVQHMQTPEQRWADLRTIGEPPPLTPEIFLANRDQASEKLKELFLGTTLQLQLDTHFPDQVVDFVCAYVATQDADAKVDTVGLCLIISSADAWTAITTLRARHVLIADFDLDEADAAGARLLERARRAGHAAIIRGKPGGIPHPNRVTIPNPRSYQVQEALEKAGYNEQRARVLAQRSNGNLSSLLRCLQNLSLMPQWAEGTQAAELAIAELLGSWNERSDADRAIVERLSGKPYGEWIGRMREIALRPGTPLIGRDGAWKLVARYEAWYALGPHLHDEHLDRLAEAAVAVLREHDPKFELPVGERYAASIHGKVLRHSGAVRTGLAESLALLGSHAKALRSSSFGKPEATAALAVREILAGADWVLWASLNGVLPLLAEAAPDAFLDAVEEALSKEQVPFRAVFAQETSGAMGGNYMTGLLWGLETLAWDPEYLTRVVVTLGELASLDPGGNWANRPLDSLSTILLPWLPQTCAPISKRRAAVATLIQELPEIAWRLLLSLLPNSHQTSMGSRKPVWRETIPDDYAKGVLRSEYWEQIAIYAELGMQMARSNPARLADLVENLDHLPQSAHDELLEYLGSQEVTSMAESDRLQLWNELVTLVARHRKFADAHWAMPPQEVDRVAMLAAQLAPATPAFLHRRLFSGQEFDLYEEGGNFAAEQTKLEEKRLRAIEEVLAAGGVGAVLEFAAAVESPWRAGMAFGAVAGSEADDAVLPRMLRTEDRPLSQFAGGFVRGRFQGLGWQWVDSVTTSQWASSDIGQFLAYLPFTLATWERSARLLGKDESAYWTSASATPYAAGAGLEVAVDRLMKYGRPRAAIECLHSIIRKAQALDSEQAIRVLLAAVASSEEAHALNVSAAVEVIKFLQDDAATDRAALLPVEWAYLPLLDRHHRGVYPKVLEQRLARDPAFFCEVIQAVFHPRGEPRPAVESTEERKVIARNAYRLLSEWRTLPGSREDGAFDGDTLASWLEHVKTICRDSGHLEVAMTMVGHILFHAPRDPEGLWIHRSAADVLNAKDAKDMRDGFVTEVFNSRDVHGFTAGREERQLADKYRTRADEAEACGYHRVANSLRELAAEYEQAAEREASRDPYE